MPTTVPTPPIGVKQTELPVAELLLPGDQVTGIRTSEPDPTKQNMQFPAELFGGGGNANANLLDPYNVPLEVRNYVVDDSRVWFGPPGGEAIYLADDLPATARPGHTWDDPDANVNYLIFPVAFADRTVITCRRTALIAPTP